MAISTVRQSLMRRFVPENIGFTAISRENYINDHVSAFANRLYNPDPEVPRAISIIDGTYTYVHKSSDFKALRQSYSVHKGEHLVKPHIIVAPDGFILEIQGPYFADRRNNDASILQTEFQRDVGLMRQWFQEGDIVIVDRGYRDATELLEHLGIVWKMPSFLERGELQLNTEESNASRLVTIQRWVVEARNGHFKSIFKFLGNSVQIQHVPHIGDFYRIAGALINRFHPPLVMDRATIEFADKILAKAQEPNVVQTLVETENLRNRIAQRWLRLDAVLLNDFPILTIAYLKAFTFGTYQIKLAPSYVQDKLRRDDDEEFQIEMSRDENHVPRPGFLRIRVYSRFKAATKYQIWIAYVPTSEQENQIEEDIDHIQGHYCTCRSGARTVGCCAHITSVIWFLGYARHNGNVKYPCTKFINSVQDAGNRQR